MPSLEQRSGVAQGRPASDWVLALAFDAPLHVLDVTVARLTPVLGSGAAGLTCSSRRPSWCRPLRTTTWHMRRPHDPVGIMASP